MSESKTIKCLNCGTSFKGNYCASCGQAATVTKLTWKSLLDELVHFFTHAEHSFVYTSRGLFTRSGAIVKEFLDGKRKKVHKPITFILIWFTIYKLLGAGYSYLVTNYNLGSFTKTETALGIKWYGSKNESLLHYENFITILILGPLFVLLGWVIFRKTKTSFVERWVAIIYGSAYTAMISVILSTLGFLLRLTNMPIKTGFINDLYFLVYFFSIAWFIYGFEKIFRPNSSKLNKLFFAVLMSLVANYAADLIWYLLYRFIPA